MNRFKIALIIAGVATVLEIIGLLINHFFEGAHGEGAIGVGILLGLVSYLFAGLLTALKMAKNIGIFGFIFAPFPVNIFIGLLTIVFALYALLFLPIIPIFKAYRENSVE